jgi:hypothetical protein
MLMTRSHIVALLALVAAVPAAAVGTNSFLWTMADDAAPCFAAGNIGYELTSRANADFVIRIDNAAAKPDLVLQLVDDPVRADFVLADGAETTGACAGTRAIRTIRIDAEAREPDLTVALRPHDAEARYRIYANSPDFSSQDAAALFAVMMQSGHKSAALRNLAARNDDITGSLTPHSPGPARQ